MDSAALAAADAAGNGNNIIPTPLTQGYVTPASDLGDQAKNSNDASSAVNEETLTAVVRHGPDALRGLERGLTARTGRG